MKPLSALSAGLGSTVGAKGCPQQQGSALEADWGFEVEVVAALWGCGMFLSCGNGQMLLGDGLRNGVSACLMLSASVHGTRGDIWGDSTKAKNFYAAACIRQAGMWLDTVALGSAGY